MKIRVLISKYIARFLGGDRLADYLRKQGMKIGENPRIFCDISTSESYLVDIGDNVTISNDVQFITHDASINKVLPEYSDLFGKITIGNNCFIGARSIIMYGVTLPDNTIVASGSVITKSVNTSGKIIGGNPAKIIGSTNDFAEKSRAYAVNIHGMTAQQKRTLLENEENLVIR